MLQLGGFASTRGEVLFRLHELAPGGSSVGVIVADHADSGVLDTAADYGIPTAVVPAGELGEREVTDRLLDICSTYELDLVCLDDYPYRLPDRFLESAPVALSAELSLDSSGTDDPMAAVLAAGARLTGCSIRVIRSDEAPGPVVTQEPVPIYAGETVESLRERVYEEGVFAAYPRAVKWLAEDALVIDDDEVEIPGDTGGGFPARRLASADRWRELRYGENPHQAAAVYRDTRVTAANVVGAEQLNESAKALSYNNYNDADAALGIVREFNQPAATVVKHTNPAGCATADTIETAYQRALATDPMSAFGGIVALNRQCNVATAEAITDSFKEVVVAPAYTDAALDVLVAEDDLRVLAVGPLEEPAEPIIEQPITGGRLRQERDVKHLTPDDLEVVTARSPTDAEITSLLFAWHVVKHVKSNAIVFASGTETVGVGAGQMSRVDAVRLASMKADEHAEGKTAAGGVMASDAFFPFPDGVEVAAEAGIEAVIQPGGSVNDEEVIAAADDRDLAMVHTGVRAFRHD